MKYINVCEAASHWKVSERSARNYCTTGKVKGAVLDGKIWKIPADAPKPPRKPRAGKISEDLLTRLQQEKVAGIKGGIYHKVQIELTYNSNHIEGNSLTHDQTRFIFDTNTIGVNSDAVKVDDVVETANHFCCINMIIDAARYKLSESFIKQLHLCLKSGTSDSRKSWFAVRDYKRLPNEVGGLVTTAPENVSLEIKQLLKKYNSEKEKSFEDIVAFHHDFEIIHPFQDGNGRIGRLIMFKECLRNGITPFIISDDLKGYYYRGLKEWKKEPGYLLDTCRTAQDRFKVWLDYFKIKNTKRP